MQGEKGEGCSPHLPPGPFLSHTGREGEFFDQTLMAGQGKGLADPICPTSCAPTFWRQPIRPIRLLLRPHFLTLKQDVTDGKKHNCGRNQTSCMWPCQ
jgi:hypothetical protein